MHPAHGGSASGRGPAQDPSVRGESREAVGLPRVTYIGHSTVLLEMSGVRVLTDPLLRDRVAHLYRYASSLESESFARPDVILISHLHLDHLDLPSLRRLGRDRRLIVPFGSGRYLRRRGFSQVEEAQPGDVATAGTLHITAIRSQHSGLRPPFGPVAVPVGYVIAGERSVYFPGDTDIFPEMADLAGTIDVALMPIAGWGRTVGPGHLDPKRAAEALTLLQPSIAIPIHWGTFAHIGMTARNLSRQRDAPLQFAEYAASAAPDVTVKIVHPTESVTIV